MKRIIAFIAIGALTAVSLAIATRMVLLPFKPEGELRRMLVAMSEAKTVRLSGAFSWSRQEEGSVTTTLYTKGQVNLEDPGRVEHATKFRVAQIAEQADEADLQGEVRRLSDMTYLFYEPPGPDVAGVSFEKDMWIALSSAELNLWGPIIPGVIFPLSTKENARAWTAESLSSFREYLRVANIFTVNRVDDITELVAGVPTRMFDVTIDRDAAGAFLRDVIRYREGREPTNEERLLVEERATALSRLSIRLWIGTDDHRLYRVQAAGLVDEGRDSALTPVDLLVHFDDYDAPFAVERPKEVLTFGAFAKGLGASLPTSGFAENGSGDSGSLLGSADAKLPTVDKDDASDLDQDGLSDLLEAFYGTDARDPDTDQDGESDGDEVLAGRNPRGSGSLFGFGLPE